MSWPIFVGVSNSVEATTTSHTLVTTGISSLAAGDFMIACIASRIASTTSITLPAGWTLVAEQKVNDIVSSNLGKPSAMMAYHVRGASNPSMLFTHPVAPSVALGRIVAYRNIDIDASLDVSTAFTTGTNVTSVSGAGLTTTAMEDLIVAMAAGGQEAGWDSFNAATDPVGASAAAVTTVPGITWSERADSSTITGADTSLGIFDAMKRKPGATGNLTVTATTAAAHAIIAAAFRIRNISGTILDFSKTSLNGITLSNVNRTATRVVTGAMYATSLSTSSSDGTNIYAEVVPTTFTGYAGIGVSNQPIADSSSGGTTNWMGWDTNSVALYGSEVWHNNLKIGDMATVPAATDVIGISVYRPGSPPGLWFKNVTKGEAWVPPHGLGFDISSLGTGPLYVGCSLINDPGPMEGRTFNFDGTFAIPLAQIEGATRWDGTPINPVHYTMPAVVGARTVTRIAAILARGRVMVADTGARVLNFIDAGLNRGYKLAVDTGAFVLTGVVADLIRATAYALVATTAAFTLTGYAVGTLRTRVLEAVQGAVTLTGNTANLIRTYIMAAAQGVVTLSGYAAGLVTVGAKVMIASTGALLLSGKDAGLQYARIMVADTGARVLAGQAVNLIYGIARWLIAELGALLLTGKPANLVRTVPTHYRLNVTLGAFMLSQNQAALIPMLFEKQPGPLMFGRRVTIPNRW